MLLYLPGSTTLILMAFLNLELTSNDEKSTKEKINDKNNTMCTFDPIFVQMAFSDKMSSDNSTISSWDQFLKFSNVLNLVMMCKEHLSKNKSNKS